MRWKNLGFWIFARGPIGLAVAAAFCLVAGGIVTAGPIAVSGQPVDQLDLEDLGLPPANDEVMKAVGEFRSGKVEQSLERLLQACRRDQSLPPAQLILAKLFFGAGRAGEARIALEQAAVDAPNDPGVSLMFGRLALAEGRLTDARLQFVQALRLSDGTGKPARQVDALRVEANSGLATVAEAQQRWGTAAERLRSVLQLAPNDGPVRQRLARALFELGDQMAALVELQQAYEHDPTLDPPGTVMGWYFARREEADRAEASMRQATQDFPGNPRAHLGLALWLVQQERFAEAQPFADRAFELDSDSFDARVLQGLIARHSGDLELAEEIFEELLDDHPDSFLVGNQQALVLAEQPDRGRQRKALALAQMNVRQYPREVEAASTLGWVQYRVGEIEKAVRTLRAVADSGRASADAHYYLARALSGSGSREEIETLLKQAIQSPTGRFSYRKEAREWMEQLNAGAASGDGPTS